MKQYKKVEEMQAKIMKLAAKAVNEGRCDIEEYHKIAGELSKKKEEIRLKNEEIKWDEMLKYGHKIRELNKTENVYKRGSFPQSENKLYEIRTDYIWIKEIVEIEKMRNSYERVIGLIDLIDLKREIEKMRKKINELNVCELIGIKNLETYWESNKEHKLYEKHKNKVKIMKEKIKMIEKEIKLWKREMTIKYNKEKRKKRLVDWACRNGCKNCRLKGTTVCEADYE